MKFILTLVAAVAAQPVSAEIAQEKLGYPLTVTKIVDGDTFHIDARAWSPFPKLSWSIRIRGIDTPEKRSKCVAERDAAMRAQRVSETLITKSGNRVYARNPSMDKYGGRFDGDIYLANGFSLGEVLIKSGLARAYTGGKRLPWCDPLGRLIP